MKLLLVLLLAAAACGLPAEPEERFNEQELIDLAVDFFRDLFKNGNADLGVPRLCPYETANSQFNLPGQLISVWMGLFGAKIEGLSEFRVNRASFDPHSMIAEYDITLPHMSIRADNYRMIGHVFRVLPMWGDGIASYDIHGLRMLGSARLGISPNGKSIIIEEIGDATFSLVSVDANTTGHIGGGDIDVVCNKIVQDLAADYMTRFSRTVSRLTTPIIRDMCNIVLEQLDTAHHLRHYTERANSD